MEIVKEPIVEACLGCDRIVQDNDKQVCKSYAMPKAIWRSRTCPMASHVKKETIVEKDLNPLKKSKRSMRKR